MAEARRQYQEQLNALDDQIRLETIKVEKNRELFNLTNDIAELKRRDEEFTLRALEVQIAKLKELKELVAGLNNGGTGFLNSLSGGNVFNITINSSGSQTGAELADSFAQEMQTRFRLGL